MLTQSSTPREARLSRPAGANQTPQAVALLLPAGEPESTRRPSPVQAAAMRPLARRLARAGRQDDLAAYVVHYRVRGWNGDSADAARDAEWALAEVVRRYGDIPVCLIGTDIGGRAALRAAGHPAVHSVLAVAPWLPDQGAEAEPVRQLAGRPVMIIHGTDDQRTDPELTFRLAERAKKANPGICRFEVHSARHGLHQHRAEVFALAENFVLGSLFARGYARPVADALAAPPPLGLRMPLALGFGSGPS